MEKTTADKPILISKLPHTDLRIEVELSLDGSDKNLVGVGSFYVTNAANGISMPVLNTGLQQVNTHWAKDGVPLDGATISATNDGKVITGTTDSEGNFLLTMKPGVIPVSATKGSIKMTNEIQVFPPSNITDPKAAVMAEPQIYAITTGSIGSKSSTLISPTMKNVVLGDVSGSMGSGSRMQNLKDYLSLALDAVTSGEIFIATWDTQFYPCTTGYIPKGTFLNVKNSYIASLRAKGGNHMQQAIEKGVAMCPGVQIVTILCDGDICPFNVNTWKSFRSKYPLINFNFIALEKDSSWKDMAQMAHVGNGGFMAFNC